MTISENIKNRRDYLLEWLKPELEILPVAVYSDDNIVMVSYQESLICGVEILDESYRVFNVSDEWKEKTSYHCEQADDNTWFYYLESVDECISQCKMLVFFEAKKGNKSQSNVDKSGTSIEIMGKELEVVRKEFIGLNSVQSKRRAREPEYFKLYYANEFIGEIWDDPKGPTLWTNTVSIKDKSEAKILPRRVTTKTPDVLYLKESNSDAGFHYTMLISDFDKIPDAVRHLIHVIKGIDD
ncbi:hypothetical protein [Butyrivibrio sp. MC2013]|uniref:hypothetical protein n=1 Tax=Butyrivibrio sp. MC2013 TaxID=1280686 RepID=UPI00040432BB|nr:hypothetical protein [Butyrivibrio sp. MC2013]